MNRDVTKGSATPSQASVSPSCAATRTLGSKMAFLTSALPEQEADIVLNTPVCLQQHLSLFCKLAGCRWKRARAVRTPPSLHKSVWPLSPVTAVSCFAAKQKSGGVRRLKPEINGAPLCQATGAEARARPAATATDSPLTSASATSPWCSSTAASPIWRPAAAPA